MPLTKKELLALAIDAMFDTDAFPVLLDALEEREERIDDYFRRVEWTSRGYFYKAWEFRNDAVAAVLLFDEWPTRESVADAWPMVQRCVLEDDVSCQPCDGTGSYGFRICRGCSGGGKVRGQPRLGTGPLAMAWW